MNEEKTMRSEQIEGSSRIRAALSVSGIRVEYDTRENRRGSSPVVAVSDANFEVAPGEIVALLGPSGCGKSTMLRVIAGLEPVVAGVVRWDGADLAEVPTHQRGFGLVFQDGQLFAHRDVAENIAYGLRAQGVPREQREARVNELLDLVGLAGAHHRSVSTLSGGERQRVALARSLAPRPRLLMLDEPFSALDRELRERLATETRAILRESGTTAILVTHDHAEANAVADRIVRMRAGRVTTGSQMGDAAELGTESGNP